MEKSIKMILEEREDESNIILLEVNENEAGYIAFSNVNDNIVAAIEDVRVNKEYRGCGYYRMLLTSVFNLAGYQVLLSNNRNDSSNPIYQKWCKNQEIDYTDLVEIRLDGEDFEFDVID